MFLLTIIKLLVLVENFVIDTFGRNKADPDFGVFETKRLNFGALDLVPLYLIKEIIAIIG